MRHASWLFWFLAVAASARQESTLEAWARENNVEIVADPSDLYPLDTPHGKITGKEPNRERLDRYRPLLLDELRKYPSEFFRTLKLSKLVFAEELRFDDQKRAGIPDFHHATLHLDPEEGVHSKTYQQTVIHHELFHIVDWKDDGELYEDRSWKKLNPTAFRYGNGGRNARGNDQWQLDDSLEGFLNKYSMSGVEEDKAEIFCNLMVRAGVVQERAAKDKVIAKKVERIRKIAKAFCRSLDDRFWNSLEE